MKQVLKILTYIIIILFVYEVIQGAYRQFLRRTFYTKAQQKAVQINKPLVVIGDPYNGIGSKLYNSVIQGYGCGDETVDLTGAPKCPNGIKRDILSYLRRQPDNSKVLFISCVLEYVDDIEDIIKEIYRVAGSIDNIFIVSINAYSITAYFYKDKNDTSKNVVYGPPLYPQITYSRV